MSSNKIILLAILTVTCLLVYCSKSEKSVDTRAKDLLGLKADSLEMACRNLRSLTSTTDSTALREAFLKMRLAYKKTEWFCEYYAPTLSRELNGAPLREMEIEETKAFEPSGLQVIEEYLYPYSIADTADLNREVRSIQSSLKRFRVVLENTEFTEAHLFDACKLELFRVIAVGLTGFDAPLSKQSIAEASIAIQSVAEVMSLLGNNDAFQKQVADACRYLSNKSFDTLNRMEFIQGYANPLTATLVDWQQTLKIKAIDEGSALRGDAKTLFDKDLFNIDHFVNTLEARPNPDKIALGKALFSDNMVSGTSQTCQSCHKPALAFTDGLPKSAAIVNGRFVKRNAPTLYYAGLQNFQFYDMRSPTLESQITDVIANKDEMHGSVEDAAKRLQRDTGYYKRFKAAFPNMENDIKPRYVMIAIAGYIRSLNPFNSRFDEYMRGNKAKMNNTEIEGFNLFMGKAKCGTCHFMPLFNGTAAPVFASTEAEVLGVPANPYAIKKTIDPDEGRYVHNKIPDLKYAFKTPTLRNIERTAPYMHNGAYHTLDDVMDFYNKGGGAGIGFELENQTLPHQPLGLNKQELAAIAAFLKTLTDQL